jgi:RNA polymerase sigma-70 factor, ECF subfamily
MASSSIDRSRPQFPPERFAEIVTPLLNSLVRVARRILRSDDLAWDAVQEALLTLWLEAELPPNPRAWLIRTVVNRSLHLARTRARRSKYEGHACRNCPEASGRDDPASKLENEDLVAWVYGAFSRIAPEQRDVLVLRVVEEMDYEAIAQVLQIPLGTVRSRLNRSRKAIRSLVRQLLPDESHEPVEQDEERG